MTLDVMANSPFVSTRKYKAICNENLVINQMSLRAFFHEPLQLLVITELSRFTPGDE